MKQESRDLFERIKQEIDEIPVIDLHCHIKVDTPNAKNLAELLFYHFVCWELVSSGRDIRKDLPNFAHPLPEDNEVIEKVLAKYIPHFEELRNTTTYWGLNKISKDLYNFDLQDINGDNWRLLYDKVLKTANDDKWTEEVLMKRGKAKTIVPTIPNTEEFKRMDRRWVEKGLFSPSFEGNIMDEIKDDLSAGQSIKEALRNFFSKCKSLGIKSLTSSCNISELVFAKVSNLEADKLREKSLGDEDLSPEEENKFSNIVLEVADEIALPWIMAFGLAGRGMPSEAPGHSILLVDHNKIVELCKALHHYKRVKAFLYAPAYTQSQEICTAARMFPNIYPMGFQWHGFFFPYIERVIEERLQTLPMNKPVGFMSDAYYTEWFHGKLCIVRHALAKVLSQKIEEGLYTEDLALKIAKRWLYDNPKEAYFGGENG